MVHLKARNTNYNTRIWNLKSLAVFPHWFYWLTMLKSNVSIIFKIYIFLAPNLFFACWFYGSEVCFLLNNKIYCEDNVSQFSMFNLVISFFLFAFWFVFYKWSGLHTVNTILLGQYQAQLYYWGTIIFLKLFCIFSLFYVAFSIIWNCCLTMYWVMLNFAISAWAYLFV